MFRNILVPTDGSALSRRAVRRAMRLAKEQKARVTGLWVGPVWQPNLYAYDESVPAGFISPRQFAAHVRKIAARQLGAVRKAAAAAGVPCRMRFRRGRLSPPGDHQGGAAQPLRPDRHGLARAPRHFAAAAGQPDRQVLAHARIPVMVCR